MATTNFAGDIDYTLRYSEKQVHREKGRPCTMMMVVVTIDDINYHLDVPCIRCGNGFSGGMPEYLEHYETELIAGLASLLPGFSIVDPRTTNIIKTLIFQASSSYRCPKRRGRPAKNATVTLVEIDIENYPVLYDEDLDGALMDVDADPPRMKPASSESLEVLVENKVLEEEQFGCEVFESGWVPEDHDCVICMEKIQRRIESTDLPCSHVFHEECIIPWLEKSHLCPLCRYAMPTHSVNSSCTACLTIDIPITLLPVLTMH